MIKGCKGLYMKVRVYPPWEEVKSNLETYSKELLIAHIQWLYKKIEIMEEMAPSIQSTMPGRATEKPMDAFK
jgi:hypothetical protein